MLPLKHAGLIHRLIGNTADVVAIDRRRTVFGALGQQGLHILHIEEGVIAAQPTTPAPAGNATSV